MGLLFLLFIFQEQQTRKAEVLDLCQLRSLTLRSHKIKTPCASPGIEEINYQNYLIASWISWNRVKNTLMPHHLTEYIPYFILKSKITCLLASWPSITFSDDTDLMFQFYLPHLMVKFRGSFAPAVHLTSLCSHAAIATMVQVLWSYITWRS